MLLKRNRSFNIYWIIPIFFLFAYTYSYTQERYTWENIPNQVKERKAFKRFEWFYRQRALPYDTIPDGAIEHARQNEIRKERNLSRTIQSANLTWSQIGPTGVVSTWPSQWGVVSGRVRAIAVHPTDPNTVYVGPAAGGVWKTTDGGTSWQDVGFNLASLTFGAIAIDPSNPNIVYAGAGEAMRYFNTIMYDGKGLYKSTDAGASWTQITNGIGSRTHFGAVKVSPTNSSTVYAALASGYWHWGYPGNEGLWRSTDAGITWTRTLNVDDGFDVLPHPTTANRVYGATGGGVSTAGFYISTDNGASWTKSSSGLPTSTLIDRIQIALPSSTPATIYALIFDGTNNTMTLYKSTNDGSSWAATSSSYSSGQGWYDLVLGVNPTNVNEVYIGDAELRRSTDGGVNFSYVGGSYWSQSMHVDFHYMVFAPSNTAYRYIGCDGGIYRSTNSGSSWTNLNNLPTLQYYRLASHPTNQNIVLGGAQDNGLYQTTNGGAGNWTLVSTGDGMESFYDYTNPNTVYASTQNGGLVKSTTGGNYGSFYNIQPSTGSQPWAWTAPFIIHPTNNLTIYTATDRPWRSTDGGSSWAALTGSALTSVAINTMAQSPVNPNNMILAGSEYTYSPTVHVSTNGGTVWTNVTSNIGGTARYISRVVFHPTQGSTVFVVRSGFSAGNKIYRSTNLGTTWTNISGDLPDVPHNDLFIDPAITTEMYTANDLGVYRSTNDGTNWIRQGNNFPYVPTHDFDYFNSGGVRLLRAGTHGRSAYQATLPTGPSITSFTPSSGRVGDAVIITGSGFNAAPNNNIVNFGGVRAAVAAGSSTSLSVTVPAGATYAPISVTTGNLTVYSSAFFKVTFPTGSGIIDTASFAPKTDFSTQTSPWGVGVADVDGDGKLDVGVANSGSSSISILRNTSSTSSISFATKVDFSLGDPSPRNLTFGDLDGDSILDVAAVRQSNNSVGVFRNTSTVGSISLASRQDFGVSTNPFDLVIGDIDGDGKPDIAVANGSNMTVLRNTSTVGSISFATNVDFLTGNGQRSIAIGDFDGDSKPDIATVSINYSTLYVFRNTSTSGSISFASAVQYSTGNAVYEVAVGDVDNDSKLDISVINNLDNTVSVFRNTCTVGNISFDARVNFTIGNGGSCIALENLNGDVKPDVIAANYTDNTLSILRNTSASISFDGKVDFGTGTNPYGCISGDIDGNGAPELIAANQANNTVSILRNRLADTYIITASVVGNGSITPSGSVVVLHGANQSFTITPNVGHHIDSITVDGTRVDSTTSYTFYNVTYAHTITAYFSINQYTITASVVGNGTIVPSGSIIVTHGTNQSFTISPAANHHVDSIVVDGVKVDSTTGYTFLNIVTGHTITAYFSIDTYTIIASATSNGWISPSGTIIVTHGSDQSFTFGPNPNAVFDSLFVDDLYIDSSSSYTFYNVTANHTIHAKFLSTVHTITVVQNSSGTISPGTTDVPHGGSQTFTITPDAGYHVDSVQVDGFKVDSLLSYTFYNVTSPHSITAYYSINIYTLIMIMEGSGTVTKDPDQPTYNHGTSVELTAVPDDLSWKFKEWSGDATGTTNPLSIIMDANKNITATFERDSAYMAMYRSFMPESVALDVDNKGKINKYVKRKPIRVDFLLYVVCDSNNVNDLHMEFSHAIEDGFPFGTIPPSTATPAETKNKKWDFAFSTTLNAGDTVYVYGYGNKGKEQKISKYWWSRDGAQLGKSLKTVAFVHNIPKLPMPNRVNALYETILYNGYGTDGFIVGKNRKTPVDSSKYYGWLQTVKYKDILKTLIKTKTMQMHNGQARGFDVFASNGKSITKQQKSIPPDKHDNELLAELIALKFGITASSMGFTPVGFGELMYNDGTTNPLNNKTVAEIAGYGDSIIMGWYDQLTESKVFAMDDIYENLYQTIRRIDSVFEGVLDTVSFGDSLEFKGVRQLADVPFLQYSSLIPARIILLERGWQQPMEFALHQNYPNPFNPITTIEFELPEESFATLKIYNTLGQEVATILDHEVMDEGTQEIEFDASHLSSGVYFYRIIAGRINEDESTISSFQTVKKMIVIK